MEQTKETFKASKSLKILIITLSDRASSGKYQDLSGPAIRQLLEKHLTDNKWNFTVESSLIPDDAGKLKHLMLEAKESKIDILFTTGGTGIGPRDITPDVIKPMLDKEIPGIMEVIRVKYGMQKPAAALSRGVAGLMDNTLIFTLPGGLKAVNEYMEEILKSLDHIIFMIYGLDFH